MPPRIEVLPLPVGSQATPSWGAKFRFVAAPDCPGPHQGVELRDRRVFAVAAARLTHVPCPVGQREISFPFRTATQVCAETVVKKLPAGSPNPGNGVRYPRPLLR